MGNLCGFKQNPALKNQVQFKFSEPSVPINFNNPYSQNQSIYLTPGNSLPPNIVGLNNLAAVSPIGGGSMRGSMRRSMADGDPSNMRNSRASRQNPDIVKELFEPGSVAPKGTEDEEEGKFKTLFKKKGEKSAQKSVKDLNNVAIEDASTNSATPNGQINATSNTNFNIKATTTTPVNAFGFPVTPQKFSPVTAVAPAASPIASPYPPSPYAPSPHQNRVILAQNISQPQYSPMGIPPTSNPYFLNAPQPFDYSPVQRGLNFNEQPWQNNTYFQTQTWVSAPNGLSNYQNFHG